MTVEEKKAAQEAEVARVREIVLDGLDLEEAQENAEDVANVAVGKWGVLPPYKEGRWVTIDYYRVCYAHTDLTLTRAMRGAAAEPGQQEIVEFVLQEARHAWTAAKRVETGAILRVKCSGWAHRALIAADAAVVDNDANNSVADMLKLIRATKPEDGPTLKSDTRRK